jgi:hypothetical protein
MSKDKIEIKSGKVVASDPCYTLDVHCLFVTEIDNGIYQVYAEKSTSGYVNELVMIKVQDDLDIETLEKRLLFDDIGVDCGSFGFFDYDRFLDTDSRCVICDDSPLESFVPTGVGDGTFDLFGYYNNDVLVGLRIAEQGDLDE